jgi:hypothetical protein
MLNHISHSRTRKLHLAVLSAAAVTLGSFAMSAHADVIADWTFETSAPATAGPFAPEIGQSTATAEGFHAGTTVYSSPVGNGSTHSYSSTNWATGDYYEFDVNTTGVTGLGLSFDQTGSATGPKQFKIEYNLGSGWVDLTGGSYNIANTTTTASAGTTSIGWNTSPSIPQSNLSFDLSTLTGLTGIRIVDIGTSAIGTATAIGTGGTIRVDNVTFSGTAAPEPATAAIAAVGAAFMIGRRRRAQ